MARLMDRNGSSTQTSQLSGYWMISSVFLIVLLTVSWYTSNQDLEEMSLEERNSEWELGCWPALYGNDQFSLHKGMLKDLQVQSCKDTIVIECLCWNYLTDRGLTIIVQLWSEPHITKAECSSWWLCNYVSIFWGGSPTLLHKWLIKSFLDWK